MSDIISLGLWIKRRRKALDLTQDALAQRVGCSLALIQKIEADARRPSREIAARLADTLELAAEERVAFIQAARAELGADRLAPPTQSVARGVFMPAQTMANVAATPELRQATPPHNLPTPPTVLIGRKPEIAQICALLRTSAARLVTLTGPGGIGKTRLGLQSATTLLDNFPDGVWLVELASLADPALVSQAIIAVLDVHERSDRPLVSNLMAFLRAKQLLLLLDNCEHLIDACAHIVETLLHACPLLHILVTSREALSIAGEVSIAVPSLAMPNPRARLPVDQIVQHDAIQLFVARAVAVQPSFRVTPKNAPTVVQMCHQLDGIPLAIELAAARIHMLTVEQIAARLTDRFRLLTKGNRTALPRQQTLQALIDWSYDLLTVDERALLRSLTVFAGGWTIEAAETVCAGVGTGDVLNLLTRLVDKSLVQVKQRADAVRYGLLETIHQYGWEKLTASTQAGDMRDRHGTYFLALAEAAPEWYGPRRMAWLEQLAAEHDNLRAALQWAIEQPAGDIAVRLAGALGWFWYRQDDWNEGRTWLQRALALGGATKRSAAQAWLLYAQGHLASKQGDIAGAQALFEESLALFRELHDSYGIATVRFNIAATAKEQGDIVFATEVFEEQLNIAREHGSALDVAEMQIILSEVAVMREDVLAATALIEPSLAQLQALGHKLEAAWALNQLGHVARLTGDYERAAALYRESLPLIPETMQWRVACAFEGLGEAGLAQIDLAAALTHFTNSLHIFQDLGDPAIVWSLAGLGSVAALDEEPKRAAQLWGAVEALRETTGKRVAPASRATYERAVATARAQLGEAAFAAAWAAGRALTLEQAIAEALNR